MEYRKKVLAIIAGILFCFSLLSTDIVGKNDLWSKAVEFERQTKEAGIMPQTMVMTSIIKNKSGKVEESSEIKMKMVEKGNEIETEIVSVIENGKDVTAEAKKEAEKNKKESESSKKDDTSITFSFGESPFDPDVQKNLIFKYESDTILYGTQVSVFTFTEKSEDGKSTTKGKTYLDSLTGMPLKVESSTEPLPRFVKKIAVTVNYSKSEDGYVIPSTAIVEGEGGFLFMKYFSESKITFSDYKISSILKKKQSENKKSS
jgi:hypothetical protein